MKRNLFLAVILAAVMWAVPSFAGLSTVDESPNSSTIYEINNATPGTSKAFLGTRLRGLLQEGYTTSAACTSGVTACNNISTTEDTAVTFKTTGASYGESISLANGYQNQLKTYVLVTDGGRDFFVTPVTKTGFTSVQLNEAKDSVTLRYVDSTKGWVIAGNNGASVN